MKYYFQNQAKYGPLIKNRQTSSRTDKQMTFTTIFTSNIPVLCHILKGRLQTDGLDVFIYDEHTISVHPFRAVLLGGVKVKVPSEQAEQAKLIMQSLLNKKLIDESGEYNLEETFELETARQNETLKLKCIIRSHPDLLDRPEEITSELLSTSNIAELILAEREFHYAKNKPNNFTWNQFWYELFDPRRSFFRYLRPRTVDYFLDKELVELYANNSLKSATLVCPECKSENVRYGYAIDNKWDIAYLILSFLITIPFPLVRKNNHCFDCGANFNGKNIPQA